MKDVVIVESPAKAKTINKYLGSDFVVIASYGHVRDLPSKSGSVLPDQDFSMSWELDDRGQRQINDIARYVRQANTVYLATDPDREGEAISWHVQEILSDMGLLKGKKVQRIVFHEITKKAVQQAMQSPRDVSQELVDAYLARRALDYLVGFTLSPVLWRKLPGARSAGRVQSVALRLIVERENEVERFKTQEYWSVKVKAKTAHQDPFTAQLTHLNKKKLEKFDLPTAESAQEACKAIEARDFFVGEIERKQVKRNPAAPFTTSTLQQEASRKLGFGASRTMQLAQKLYEGVDLGGETTGLITYMRTDSVHMAKEAVDDIRNFVGKTYGEPYVPSASRSFKNKSKNAQEAHEAVRPTDVKRTPQDVASYLDPSQLSLYTLIWKRSVASQMAQAVFDQVGIPFTSSDGELALRSTGSTLVFDGFLKLYQEGVDDKDQDSEDEEGRLLPPMKTGEGISKEKIEPGQHFTQPPPRFSEASLVKKMEELGIGRPSTYASIIKVLQDRQYVTLDKRQFLPEERGRLVTIFLTNYFRRYVEYDFTAVLEEELDDISTGKLPWKQVMRQFWEAFYATIKSTEPLTIPEVLEHLEKEMAHHLFPTEDDKICPTCKKGTLSLKLSRYGAFLGCNLYPECKYTRPLVEGDSKDSTPLEEPRLVGKDPVTGADITLRKGPYGFYIQWDGETAAPPEPEAPKLTKSGKPRKTTAKEKPLKPKRISLPAGTTPDNLTLEIALNLKKLPLSIGVHPGLEKPMSVSVGPYGPYVRCGDVFASIPKKDDMFSLSITRAAELVDQKIRKLEEKGPVPKKNTKAAASKKKAPSKSTAGSTRGRKKTTKE